MPNIGASNKHLFSIGNDADIVYNETVTLASSTEFIDQFQQKKTRLVYQIDLQIQNFKSRSVFIEYEQNNYYSYQDIQLTTDDKSNFYRHGSMIKANFTLNDHDVQTYSYRIELIH